MDSTRPSSIFGTRDRDRFSTGRLTPFSLAQRPQVIRRILDDPAVRASIAEEAAATAVPLDAAWQRARAFAEEIVPQYRPGLHHRLAYRAARRLATMLFRVRVGHVDEAIFERIPADASVVFVVNHRSNMDYVLLAFLAAEHVALSFAVGEWARVWPLDSLVRALGAFFVRRDSKSRLYRKVLERYVKLAVEHGVTQAMFLEGGLSRDGRLRAPKFGLLSYVTKHMSPRAARDVVFVPVAVNYDRVLEDRNLLRDLDHVVAPRSILRTTMTATLWVAKNLRLYMFRRMYRFGYACVNFGPPVSLVNYLTQHDLDLASLDAGTRFAETERLATLLMDEIAHVVPVTPVSLVCTALLSLDREEGARSEIGARVEALIEELTSVGAHLYLPRRDAAYLVDVGLRMLTLRRLVVETAGRFKVVPSERRMVTYYANAIEHFFARRRPDVAPAGRARAQPLVDRAVVLVHGLARTSRSMARLEKALEGAGYAVFNWDYPSRAFGLRQLTDALEKYARDAAGLAGRLDFVTHSMGGLLARGVLSGAKLPRAGRLVMLAPPNHGARLASRASAYAWARGFYGQALDELRPERTAALETHIGRPACEFGVIAGTRSFHPLQPTSYVASLTQPKGSHDGTLTVEETRLEGMTDFVTVNANHMFIMDHDDTIRQTLYFLEHGRFRRDA